MTSSSFTKPSGLTPEYAEQFQDAAIVRAYRHREPYPPETFQVLAKIAGAARPLVADIGCGPGDLTHGLAGFASRVDAVDLSPGMLSEARRRFPDLANVSWVHAPAETAPLEGPYDLVTAADSVHWMNWPPLFASLRTWLKPGGHFAIVGRHYTRKDWWNDEFQEIINRHSTNKEFQRYDIVEELTKAGHIHVVGEAATEPIAFRQSVADLIEAFHSRNGFSRDRMGESAEAFDRAAAAHLERFAENGVLTLHARSRITWATIA